MHGGRRRRRSRFGFHVVLAWPAACLSREHSSTIALHFGVCIGVYTGAGKRATLEDGDISSFRT